MTRLLEAVEATTAVAADGSISLPDAPALGIGIVRWGAAESR